MQKKKTKSNSKNKSLYLMMHCNVIIVWIELRFNEDIPWSDNDLFASDDTSFYSAINGDIQQISCG